MAQQAERMDPALNLYDLNIAYLLGEHADESPEQLSEAIAAYETALKLEPTWDTGWINLAGLEAKRGNLELATDYLLRAKEINPITTVSIPLAEIAEEGHTLPIKDVIDAYTSGMHWTIENYHQLPLSDYWTATVLRREAIKTYLTRIAPRNADRAYRIAAQHYPYLAAGMVKENPQTAAEFWISGEYALSVHNDPELAVAYFSEAIDRSPARGDFYASRARAYAQFDEARARTDIQIAQLLGTQFEYPNALLASMESDPELRNDYLASAVPSRVVKQEVAAVLYGGRIAGFDLLPSMQPPGPGRTVLQPWYTLAEQYALNGRIEQTINVYRAILDYAREDTKATERLQELESR